MANIPSVEFVVEDDITVVCVMTFADLYHDGFKGVNYVNYDVQTQCVVGYGCSKGWDGAGAGSMIFATKNAKRSAKRYIARKRKALTLG